MSPDISTFLLGTGLAVSLINRDVTDRKVVSLSTAKSCRALIRSTSNVSRAITTVEKSTSSTRLGVVNLTKLVGSLALF